ncbi:hypothetical protein I204_07062 [Kwoniella mangroviensis CBS 8886]|uniref:uncharacterized protein n=1 Tax=Kwoniella mangroviensis CBS 8507 TaxID=1296122 RepID=UPI00080D1790|nr:uncharacterized protein I203_00965 [Kwoniella mangroviensis CBS 8507]OCF69113.1 hypothetical protein I203_00965 [Kwoniella mangroviensis CBS 8507]OCF72678.1 hypothetical protein I204_07062 [Kwoniella mangroviensis CBS 8886]
MRFSSLLFALPLLGSVFAAPAPAPFPETGLTLEKRDVDVVQTVQELANTVHGCQPLGASQTEVDVEATLTIIVGALEKCGNTLGIDLSLSVDVDVVLGAVIAPHGDIKNQVANILAQVILDINVIIKSIKAEHKKKPKCVALLARIDVCLTLILKGLSTIISGLIFLIGTILISLGVILDGVLAFLLKLIIGLLGNLLGAILCGCIL